MHLRKASLLLILTACFTPPRATVTPTKDAPSAPSKPDTCEIEFFAMDALRRPHDVLGEVRVSFGSHLPGYPSVTPEKEEMRRQACLLGADAIIGLHEAVGVRREEVKSDQYPREYHTYTLIGTAVRYRD